MALLDDAANPNTRKRPHIVVTEPFGETFGPKAQQKRPWLDIRTFEDLESSVLLLNTSVSPWWDPQQDLTGDFQPMHADYIEPIFAKGTSRHVYAELYKVIDSSDVIPHILDARDPLGTMCESVLEYLKKGKAHKQVVLVINKCDLVPNWVIAKWTQHLTPRYPTIAFPASLDHSFGKDSLIQLLRQSRNFTRTRSKSLSVLWDIPTLARAV